MATEIRAIYKQFGWAARAATKYVVTGTLPPPGRNGAPAIVDKAVPETSDALPVPEGDVALYQSTTGPEDGKVVGIGIQKNDFLRLDYLPKLWPPKEPQKAQYPNPDKFKAAMKKYQVDKNNYDTEMAKGPRGIHFNAQRLKAGGVIEKPKFAAYVDMGNKTPEELQAEYTKYMREIRRQNIKGIEIWNKWRAAA
ncbi:hypothetical protein FRC11_011483 [Ceratobasidium sp. 423]|nr:hypothetical protein FRC11_011483 [Ceratobasidium sp. 423]